MGGDVASQLMKFASILENDHIRDWISDGGKGVIGHYCAHLAEELIHAAGFLPFRIRGTGNEDFLLSDVILSRFNCTYVRSTLNLALNGKYNFLKGLVVANTCDHIRRMYGIFEKKVKRAMDGKMHLFFMSLPHRFSDEGWDWTRDEILLFKENLSKTFNISITKDDIRASLEVYDENSKLMREIHSLRMEEKPKLSGTDFLKVSLANSSVRKEYANQELKKLIPSLKEKGGIQDVRARLMVAGSYVDNPDFVRMLEHAGGIVVTDTLCTGTRSFWDEELWMPEGKKMKDEIDELVRRTYPRVLCPRIMNGHKVRLDFVKSQIKKARVEGLILQRIEFCDLHGCENMLLLHELEEELDIPVLSIDREYFMGDTGRLRTRVEAFLEKIGR